jgi:hypothetical protein
MDGQTSGQLALNRVWHEMTDEQQAAIKHTLRRYTFPPSTRCEYCDSDQCCMDGNCTECHPASNPAE